MSTEITELQMLLMDQQQTIENLDQEIRVQQGKIQQLEKQLEKLSRRMQSVTDSMHSEGVAETLEESRPPHY